MYKRQPVGWAVSAGLTPYPEAVAAMETAVVESYGAISHRYYSPVSYTHLGVQSLESLVVHAQFSHRISDFPAALALCEEITQRYPRYPNHRYILADVCAHLGNLGPARKALDALAEDRDPAEALLQRVEVLHVLGLDDEVIGQRCV